jgi:hypothetical protein
MAMEEGGFHVQIIDRIVALSCKSENGLKYAPFNHWGESLFII